MRSNESNSKDTISVISPSISKHSDTEKDNIVHWLLNCSLDTKKQKQHFLSKHNWYKH